MLRGAGVSLAQVGGVVLRDTPPASFGLMAEGAIIGGTSMAAADTVYLYRFAVPAMVVTSIFQRLLTVGAGSAVKCAVWANNRATGRATGLPCLGQNAGFDTSASTGIKSAAIANVPLSTDVYWFGTKATGTLPQMASISGFNAVMQASHLSMPTQSDALGFPGAQILGFTVPDAYANDIMALDMTGATFTPTGAVIPAIGLGWA